MVAFKNAVQSPKVQTELGELNFFKKKNSNEKMKVLVISEGKMAQKPIVHDRS